MSQRNLRKGLAGGFKSNDETADMAFESMYGVREPAPPTRHMNHGAGLPPVPYDVKNMFKRVLKADKKKRRKSPNAPN